MYGIILASIQISSTLELILYHNTEDKIKSTIMIIAIITITIYNAVEFKNIAHTIIGIIVTNIDLFNLFFFWDGKKEALIISIVGLVISAIFIVLGFRFKNKSMRLLGLITMIIYVIKISLFDIPNGSNDTISAALMLLFGGIICFIISFIYNKLDKKYGQINSGDLL